jgi:3-hydroxybutyryl-CoA dehydrogenase
MQIRKVGVIGAGQMGNGIAQVCAQSGFEVGLNDISPERIEAGIATIDGNLQRRVKSGKYSEAERKATLARIKPVATYDGFADYDLVIESAVEDEQVKRKIYQALCPHLKPEAIVGSNTSSISITRLAAATDRPEKFMGIHFMNPVPVMELVELIRGIATEEATFSAVKELAQALN